MYFASLLPQKLNVGDSIEIEGIVATDATEIAIDLAQDSDPIQNVAENINYHHKIYFDTGKTVMNNRVNEMWQTEMVVPKIFLRKGSPFCVVLKIFENAITAAFDDKFHSQFHHRMPIEDVKYIIVRGEVLKIKSLKYNFAS